MADGLEQFREVLNNSKCTLLLCHDFPDPDCLASAMGLQFLLKHWKINSVISFGGFIGRAENRALVQKLEIEALPLSGLDLTDFDRVVFVDTQPAAGNHSLPQDARRDAAIDHHPLRSGTELLPYSDVRTDTGSTCTIVTEYLRKARVDINFKLATALYCGLKSDTQDLARETSGTDREVYHYLFSRVDHRLLSHIENPDLERDYFQGITKAYKSLETRDAIGWCELGKITRPDLVAEMADLFLRISEIRWVACVGHMKSTLFFSIRARSADAEAGDVAQAMVAGEKGSAGGHGQFAAGRLEFNKDSADLIERLKVRYFDLLASMKAEEERAAGEKEAGKE